ncbi:MAG: hypothetical protein ABWY78_10555 [Microvirga sp.]
MLFIAGIFHAVFIVAMTLLGMRASSLDWPTRLCVLIAGGWTNLVLTGLLTSSISALDNPTIYLLSSCVLATGLAVILSRSGPRRLIAPEPCASVLDREGPLVRFITAFLLATGAVVLICNIILAFAYLPTNPDSISYRIPRIYWYWGQGNLGHFKSDIDPRAFFYPFNGTLLQMPIVQYHWSGVLFTFVPLGAWCLIGTTVFQTSRELGFSAKAAIASAWLACLTPGIFIQATSTNDEILAAIPLLIGVHFLVRFFRGGTAADFYLACVSAALSVGTKLHSAFAWPMLIAGLILVCLRTDIRASVVAGLRIIAARPLSTVAVAVVCGMLVTPFALINWRSAGELMPHAFTREVMNQPFSAAVGAQNFVTQLSKVVISPGADVLPISDPAARESLYWRYNRFFSPLFNWVSQTSDYMSSGYRFNGVLQQNAKFVTEDSVHIGFSYILIAMALGTCFRRRGIFVLGLMLSLSFIIWFTTYCFMTQYIEGFGVYLSFATIVAAPAFVFALRKEHSRPWLRTTLVTFVALANLLAVVNILLNKLDRNIPGAIQAQHWPLNPPLVERTVLEKIREAGGAQLISTHWEIPYWSIIEPFRQGRYSVASPAKADPEELKIYPVLKERQRQQFIPLQVPWKRTPGLSLLGKMNAYLGDEWIFAAGKDIHRDPDIPSGIILVGFVQSRDREGDGGRVITISPTVLGLSSEDGMQFRYRIQNASGMKVMSDWGEAPARRFPREGTRLFVDVRRGDDDSSMVTAVLPYRPAEPFVFEPKSQN